jgi:hypothetical protein
MDITTFESNGIMGKKISENDYRELYQSKEPSLFKEFIDKEIKEKYNYPTKQVADLISFIESRRVKSIELITILIASILGGIFGALITISQQKFF